MYIALSNQIFHILMIFSIKLMRLYHLMCQLSAFYTSQIYMDNIASFDIV